MIHGFTLHDVNEMTLSQANLFSAAINKANQLKLVNTMNAIRTAFHADTREYKDAVRSMMER